MFADRTADPDVEAVLESGRKLLTESRQLLDELDAIVVDNAAAGAEADAPSD